MLASETLCHTRTYIDKWQHVWTRERRKKKERIILFEFAQTIPICNSIHFRFVLNAKCVCKSRWSWGSKLWKKISLFIFTHFTSPLAIAVAIYFTLFRSHCVFTWNTYVCIVAENICPMSNMYYLKSIERKRPIEQKEEKKKY